MNIRTEIARPPDLSITLCLLRDAGLPTADVAEHFSDFLVARSGQDLVGVVGLEVYPRAGLLRSLVVLEEWRSQGIGSRLVEEAIAAARQRGVPRLFLLTQTAADYFPRFGFREIVRAEADAAVQQSVEFQSACPQSAKCMLLDLAEVVG